MEDVFSGFPKCTFDTSNCIFSLFYYRVCNYYYINERMIFLIFDETWPPARNYEKWDLLIVIVANHKFKKW